MEKTGGVFGPYCGKADKIKCGRCKEICLIGGMYAENGRTYQKQDPEEILEEVYFFCPCDKVHPLAVDEGRGKIQHIEASGSELICAAA